MRHYYWRLLEGSGFNGSFESSAFFEAAKIAVEYMYMHCTALYSIGDDRATANRYTMRSRYNPLDLGRATGTPLPFGRPPTVVPLYGGNGRVRRRNSSSDRSGLIKLAGIGPEADISHLHCLATYESACCMVQ